MFDPERIEEITEAEAFARFESNEEDRIRDMEIMFQSDGDIQELNFEVR